MVTRLSLAVSLIAVLASCSDFPELDDAVSDDVSDAPFAKLVPVETLQASAPDAAIEQSTRDTIEARAARLRGRASALKPDVIDAATEEQLRSATR